MKKTIEQELNFDTIMQANKKLYNNFGFQQF